MVNQVCEIEFEVSRLPKVVGIEKGDDRRLGFCHPFVACNGWAGVCLLDNAHARVLQGSFSNQFNCFVR